jgi:hypothetical protein
MAEYNIPRIAYAIVAANGTYCTIGASTLLWTASYQVHAPATVTAGNVDLQILGVDGLWRASGVATVPIASALLDKIVNLQSVACPIKGIQLVLTNYAGSGNIYLECAGIEE